jgi:hypothetical protein
LICVGDCSSLGFNPRTAAMSVSRCGAAAAADPKIMVNRVLPAAVRDVGWQPPAP